MLIPNRNFYQPELGEKVLISTPRPHFISIADYFETFRQVDVYAVNVYNVKIKPTEVMIENETGKDVEIFEDVYFPKNLLESPDRDNIAKIVIRKPGGKHNNYLILLKIEDENIRELFETFFRENLANYQIRLLAKRKRADENSDNLLRIIIDNDKKLEEIKKIIMNPFHKCFRLEPED